MCKNVFRPKFKMLTYLRLSAAIVKRTISSSSILSSTIWNEGVTEQCRAGDISVEESYGQPTACTHPHLVKASELVPGVCVEEFQNRRERLMQGIVKYVPKEKSSTAAKQHVIVIPSSTKKYMSDKIPYVFRQNSDFFYLTGCLEPDTVLVMSITDKDDMQSMMFMRPKDKFSEMWDGPRTGVDNAKEMFGVDESYASDQFGNKLKQLLGTQRAQLWYDAPHSDLHQVTESLKSIVGVNVPFNMPTFLIQSMRLLKSRAEQALMRHTCAITSRAINEVMQETHVGQSEHHIFALIDYKCRMRNASYLAYPAVVASGRNATIIHYINNSQVTKAGDLILMDTGCEYGGYTSDITRTWPISGEFTEPQKVLYDVVLQVQKDIIGALLKEGGQTLDMLFDTMRIRLGRYLQEIGLVPKDITDNQGYAKAGYKFCPHHVSHYLGMDVHDTPMMSRSIPLLPGMVFTVEPGIYIEHDCMDVPREFRGIGIRIEDDLLITPNSEVEVLTAGCSKERSDLAALLQDRNPDGRRE